jgi:spore maturation protein CgeB
MTRNSSLLFLTATDCRDNPHFGKSHHAWFHSDIDAAILGPLQERFARVIRHDYLSSFVLKGSTATNAEICALARAEKPDYALCFTRTHGYELHWKTCDALARNGCTVILIFGDDDISFDDYARYYLPHVDYCVSLTRTDAPLVYARYGRRGIFWPVGADPLVYLRQAADFKYDVSFVGSGWYARYRRLGMIERAGFRVSAFGKPWTAHLPVQQINQIINETRINLNFTGCLYDDTIKQMKGRMYEVCMGGGFLLTEYVGGIESSFTPDKEIACFTDDAEMIDKIRYYLSHEDERVAIANRGYERSRREHTWRCRLAALFDSIGPGHADTSVPVSTCDQGRGVQAELAAANFHFEWALLAGQAGMRERCLESLELASKYAPAWKVRLLRIILKWFPKPLFALMVRIVLLARQSKFLTRRFLAMHVVSKSGIATRLVRLLEPKK